MRPLVRLRSFGIGAVVGAIALALLPIERGHAGEPSTRAVAAAIDPAVDVPETRVFDAAFDDVMKRYDLPGLAVGVVVDDRVVYARTAGHLVAGEAAPITRRTLFKIASNSKAMTTATLARLVDQGKLAWTDPVTKYLPQFRMHDPWVTREMQVRDLLIHNSGLRAGAGDLMLWPEPNRFTRDDVIHGLAFLKPQGSFRARYDYDNLLYIVAGEVAAAAGGAPYETLVRREVFAPLGLARCQVGAWDRDAVGDVAQPHMRADGRNVPVRRDPPAIASSTADAAGGIRCSLDDLLTYVRAWLRAEPVARDGSVWLSAAQREAVWTAHNPMPVSPAQRDLDRTRFSAYGYGWRLSDADGVWKVAHTGTLMGMYSAVTLLPDRHVGIVMMTNGEGSTARTVLMQTLTNRFTDPMARHTVADYAAWLASLEGAAAGKAPATTSTRDDVGAHASARETVSGKSLVAMVTGTDDALHRRVRILGVYRDKWFGDVSLCERDDVVRFASAKSPMLTGTVMRIGDGALVDWDDASVDAEAWLHFDVPTETDGPTRLTMTKVDPDADFSYDYEDLAFERVADCPEHRASLDR